MTELPLKNTFIHFDIEESTPGAVPPAVSAPNLLWQDDSADDTPLSIRLPLGRRYGGGSDVCRDRFGSSTPVAEAALFAGSTPCWLWGDENDGTCREEADRFARSPKIGRQLSISSEASFASLLDDNEDVDIVVARPPVCRSQVVAQESFSAEVRLSEFLHNCDPAKSTSLGAAGHVCRTCVPCLMQVRWLGGKCLVPCKFGYLCSRCHEPHTEEELQRIQAKMRRSKKKREAAAATWSKAKCDEGSSSFRDRSFIGGA